MRSILAAVLGLGLPAAAFSGEVEPVESLDQRVVVELFAAEPQLVTPTGIAVDSQQRVFVIESHTHFRPDDYAGPPADRIRVFEDTNGDGRADRIGTFFEGTHATMGLGLSHDGWLYVATRSEIFRLRDADGDGQADERTPIARLETTGDYPHNGLSGFAFDFAGNVYFGLGENLGAPYRLVGSDGRALEGGGEGGNVYRSAPDGSNLEKIATGFWNPFHLAFDVYGRLFAVDNDPDSRPPCRLLHIVPGGDYGYRFRNGRKGLHPFTAWNGELPGTLPMVAGTGEAPSGLLVYESDGLPQEYRGALLVTSWGDHRLERYRLVPQGASFAAVGEPFVTGGENFRPVGIALAPDGSLFISDWVDKSYDLHGKGRIWHVRLGTAPETLRPSEPREAARSLHRPLREWGAKQLAAQGDEGLDALRELVRESSDPAIQGTAVSALLEADEGSWLGELLASTDLERFGQEGPIQSLDVFELAARSIPAGHLDLKQFATQHQRPLLQAAALRRIDAPAQRDVLLANLHDPDPFVRQAALRGLERSASMEDLLGYALTDDSSVRLASLLLLRQSERPEAQRALGVLLKDADPTVRFAAVQWVGELGLVEYRPQLEAVLAQAATRELFEACLASLEMLDRAAAGMSPAGPAEEERSGEEYVARVLVDPQVPLVLRRRALRMLRPDHPAITREQLEEWLTGTDLEMQLEALRTLRFSGLAEAASWQSQLAADASLPLDMRAEAIVGLSPQEPQHLDQLLSLAAGEDLVLAAESLRSLRGATLTDEQKVEVRQVGERSQPLSDLAAKVLDPMAAASSPAANDLEGWLGLLEGEADAAAGERVYFHPAGTGCYRCHQLDGRGGSIGTDLSYTARLLDRRRLVESLVDPSKEIAPQFVSWSIVKKDGTVLTGVLIEQQAGGEQTYADAEGKLFALHPRDIDRRTAQRTSLMPDNLVQLLTPQEFRDLVAFLLKPR